MGKPINNYAGKHMFEISKVDVSSLWFDVELAEIAELLVFHDKVELIMPYGRFHRLLRNDVADLTVVRRLIEDGRLQITIDDFPLGEVAADLDLMLGIGQRDIRFSSGLSGLNTECLYNNLRDHIQSADIPPITADQGIIDEWKKMRPFLNIRYSDADTALATLVGKATALTNLLADEPFLHRAYVRYKQLNGHDPTLFGLKSVPLDVDGQVFNVLHQDTLSLGELLDFISAVDFMLSENEDDDAESFITPTIDRWIEEMGRGFVERVRPTEQIEAFQRYTLGKTRISEAIRTGRRQFYDILPVIDRREPLGEMVRGKPRSEELLAVYIDSLLEKEFLEKPAGKTARWITTSTIGGAVGFVVGGPIVGAIAGAGLGAVDTFLVDKFTKKPTAARFVNEELKPFVK